MADRIRFGADRVVLGRHEADRGAGLRRRRGRCHGGTGRGCRHGSVRAACRRGSAEVSGVVDEPVALATGVDRDAHLPLGRHARGLDGECTLIRQVAEARRLASGQGVARGTRRDLAEERDDLGGGQRRLGDRSGISSDLQLGKCALVQAQGARAMADHRGEKAVELSHGTRRAVGRER